jgi:antirestriction protein ArdC
MSQHVCEKISKLIMEKLEAGVAPWRKPWTAAGFPQNLTTKKEYRGINLFLLHLSAFDSPYWLTFKQAKGLGGRVKKGEKSMPVVFWTTKTVDDTAAENGEKKKKEIPILKFYSVFNAEQCTGLKDVPPPVERQIDFQPIEKCEEIVRVMPNPPSILHEPGDNRAYYLPKEDRINMPRSESFLSPEAFYATLFHEICHSSGHKSRLNRKEIIEHNPFGSQDYGKEELVAEMGSSFLCGIAGIENVTLDNSAAYIENWLKAIREDKKLVICAAAKAQAAVDYIIRKSPERKDHEHENAQSEGVL